MYIYIHIFVCIDVNRYIYIHTPENYHGHQTSLIVERKFLFGSIIFRLHVCFREWMYYQLSRYMWDICAEGVMQVDPEVVFLTMMLTMPTMNRFGMSFLKVSLEWYTFCHLQLLKWFILKWLLMTFLVADYLLPLKLNSRVPAHFFWFKTTKQGGSLPFYICMDIYIYICLFIYLYLNTTYIYVCTSMYDMKKIYMYVNRCSLYPRITSKGPLGGGLACFSCNSSKPIAWRAKLWAFQKWNCWIWVCYWKEYPDFPIPNNWATKPPSYH